MEHPLYRLCAQEGIDLDTVLANKETYYRTFSIKKRDGRYRQINAPFGDLIRVQKLCLQYISTGRFIIHPSAKAFRRRISLADNAGPHKNQKKILKIDLKDFFGSIKDTMIEPLLGHLITQISTLNGQLPQGAPTSPTVSNIYAYPLDCFMAQWAERHGLNYTRYADDMTFSGNYIPHYFKRELDQIVRSQSLRINYKKTKLISSNYEQSVTGVVVNDKVSISKRKCRHKLRAVLYYYGKNQLELTEEIKGMLAYIKSINLEQYQKLVRDYEQQRARAEQTI
jgi:RNA-directed DNA polymerase